jgi:hypothetical protein
MATEHGVDGRMDALVEGTLAGLVGLRHVDVAQAAGLFNSRLVCDTALCRPQ